MGIKFENIKSGEVVELERPAQIAAFVNSSDLSPNSSKGQDFQWRLGVEVISQIDDIRSDVKLMQQIAMEKGMLIQDISTYHLVEYIMEQESAVKALQEEALNNNPEYKEQYEERIRATRQAKAAPAVVKAKSTEPKAKK